MLGPVLTVVVPTFNEAANVTSELARRVGPRFLASIAAADCFEGDDHAAQDGDAHADAKPLVARPDLR
jgi:hypothetical protein